MIILLFDFGFGLLWNDVIWMWDNWRW